MSAAERDLIADELRRAWDGDPWHGDSLKTVLSGVTAEQASARPLPGAHSIGELVLHLASWTREATRRLHDRVAREPEDGDWPAFQCSEPAWRKALDRLADAHAELAAAVQRFPPDDLHLVVGDERDRPLGSGVSFAVLLHGIAQHHAYHAGQIALLRKSAG